MVLPWRAAALRSSSAAQPHGLRSRSGTELSAQRLLEPLELDQCTADVAAGGARPGQGQVRILVGGLLGQHVVPSAQQP